VTSFVQYAAVEALKQSREAFAPKLAEMQARRDLCLSLMKKIPHLEVEKPKGAFYLFPEVSFYAKKLGTGSDGVAEYLLNQAGVAVVPGRPFGDDSRIRISFAKDLKTLEKGLTRIQAALQKIAP
jgi:aspartate aminotransferase